MIHDVAIIGCGPVGATLANLLGKAGHSVAVVEAESAIFDKPRAIILDHEALRVIQHCGLLTEVMPHTARHPGTDYLGAEGQVIKRYNPLPPPYPLGLPPTVSFVQPEVDAILRRGVARYPTVERFIPTRLVDLREDDEVVTLTLERAGDASPSELRARYVVGADGANSTVRRRLGLPLEDLQFDEWWMVVDARLRRPVDLPGAMIQYCRPSRPATYVIGPGDLRRWEIKVLPGEDPAHFADQDFIKEHLADFVPLDAIELWRAAVYRFHAVVGERWATRRCFLAGDAAHQMPPFLGQGLCCGIRDAANLAWKLDAVLAGRAAETLLATYEAERKPHIRDLTVTAKAFGLIIGELDPEKARARDEALRADLLAGRAEQIRQRFIPDITAGLIDRESALSRRVAGTLFVQPHVRMADGSEQLLDDVVSPGFIIVSSEPLTEAALGMGARGIWRRLGGAIVSVGGPGSGALLVETSDLLAAWLTGNGCRYVLVRPDRYVYGAAASTDDLDRLVLRLGAAL